MQNYIGPEFQLPEQAGSLHTPVDWQEAMKTFRQVGKLLGEAFTEVGNALANSVGIIFHALEDATRENAYHPEGPVICSTGFTLPENTPAREQRLIEPPYTIMHEGKPVFTNFGTIEQIVERLHKVEND